MTDEKQEKALEAYQTEEWFQRNLRVIHASKIGASTVRLSLGMFIGKKMEITLLNPESRSYLAELGIQIPSPWALADLIEVVGFPPSEISCHLADMASNLMLWHYLRAGKVFTSKTDRVAYKERTIGLARSVAASGGSLEDVAGALKEATNLDTTLTSLAIKETIQAEATFHEKSGQPSRIVSAKEPS